MNRKAFVIIGPTASGKTSYSIELAQKLNGEIINFDSLQIFNDLKILTAYPSESELRSIPHRLFGYRNFDQSTSVIEWAHLASIEISKVFGLGKLPILVGGTGFYIKTLINGINELPQISAKTRETAMKLADENFDELCRIVFTNDQKLQITKDQHHQMIRAYEILLETGKSIRYFYSRPKKCFVQNVDFKFHTIPFDRKELYIRIEKRFEKMIQNGAIDEVRDLLKKTKGKTNFPIFKAIGANEIARYLEGKLTFGDMKNLAILNSRHYAKRHITWIRHQIPQPLDTTVTTKII